VLPHEIKQAAHYIKKFKHTLKASLITNSFYSVDEYFNIKWQTDIVLIKFRFNKYSVTKSK
jgi:hypothetical protein